MKRMLNTLYITTQGARVSCEGDNIRIEVERELKLRVPVHTLDGVVCFGRVFCTPPVLGLCARHGVLVTFLSGKGRFLARVQGPVSGNVLLRREQYRRADCLESAAQIASVIVAAKAANARTVLLRGARDHPGTPGADELRKAGDHLARLVQRFRRKPDLDTARGWEGEAAHVYFSVFDHLIVSQKEDFHFEERSRRPPLDNMNALLSFLYTLLAHDVVSALESVGLDPAVGFLHRDRPGRPGLALDIMEEFRPVLADRVALSLVNRKQVIGRGFVKTESGAVTMDEKTRREVIVTWQKRKADEIRHPFLGEKIPVGLIPFAQALLLARYLRGALDCYPPFFWK
ncbi:MAG: type I-C CRISPR-associated endonuclease Cas1c [Candidatus Zixiibacteriota bacterium]